MYKIMISKDNLQQILQEFINIIKNEIHNKNIATPYLDKFIKAGLIKTDGNGNMFLCNNGEYIPIDLNLLNNTKEKMNIFLDLFKMKNTDYRWNSIISNFVYKPNSSYISYENKIYRIGDNILDVYDIKTNIVSILAPYPINVYGMRMHIYNNKIYCIGGTNNINIYNNTYIYDIKNNTWSVGTPIPNSKMNFSSNINKNIIYCIGGGTKTNVISSNNIYDIKTDTWILGNNIPKSVSYGESVYHDKYIYVFGGYDNNLHNNIVQKYNIFSGIWEQKYLKLNEGFRLFKYNNEIYKIGNSKGYIFKYNINNNNWVQINIIDITKKLFYLSIYDDKIYCIGGINLNGSINNSIDILELPYKYKINFLNNKKLNIIKFDGDGKKLLFNDGSYKIPSNKYITLTNDDVDLLINKIINESRGK